MNNLFDHLVFRAQLEPNAIALQGVGRHLTFEQLLRVAKKIAHKLRNNGIMPGQLVVTSISDRYLDWVITLALFHEAAVTCSNGCYSRIDPSFEYDWMITNRRVEHFPTDKTIQIDDAWISDALELSHEIEIFEYLSEASPVRVCLTSGTTGRQKAVAFGLGRLVARVMHGATLGGFHKRMGLFNLSVQADFAACLTCLQNGSPIYCALSPKETVHLIREFSLEILHGSPVQIAGLIDYLMAHGDRLDCLKSVRCAGGAVSPNLLKNIETYLCSNIINSYGSTEAGGVCTFKINSTADLGICGYPQPGVTVEVVDEYDQVLQIGQEGLVRVKTIHMAEEYFKNPQETVKSFRNGWFYPGDRGILAQDNLLVLTGRNSEFINRGGIKIDPVAIDQFLLDYPNIKDAAVFAVEGRLGVQEMVAAIVEIPGFDINMLQHALIEKFGASRSPRIFVKAKQIPRNKMGKVMRAAMGKKFAALAEKGSQNQDTTFR